MTLLEEWEAKTAKPRFQRVAKDAISQSYDTYGLPIYAVLAGMMDKKRTSMVNMNVAVQIDKGNVQFSGPSVYKDTLINPASAAKNLVAKWPVYMKHVADMLKEEKIAPTELDTVMAELDAFTLKYANQEGARYWANVNDVVDQLQHNPAQKLQLMGSEEIVVPSDMTPAVISLGNAMAMTDVRLIATINSDYTASISVMTDETKSVDPKDVMDMANYVAKRNPELQKFADTVIKELQTQFATDLKAESDFRTAVTDLETKIDDFYVTKCAPHMDALRAARQMNAII